MTDAEMRCIRMMYKTGSAVRLHGSLAQADTLPADAGLAQVPCGSPVMSVSK